MLEFKIAMLVWLILSIALIHHVISAVSIINEKRSELSKIFNSLRKFFSRGTEMVSG